MVQLYSSSVLRCPSTLQRLTELPIQDAEVKVGARLVPRQSAPTATGRTTSVLLREDEKVAYPISNGIPILMTPEGLQVHPSSHDMHDPRWEEAYEESEHYNRQALLAADSAIGTNFLKQLTDLLEPDRAAASNRERWVDAPY